jgi:hypothetical protein
MYYLNKNVLGRITPNAFEYTKSFSKLGVPAQFCYIFIPFFPLVDSFLEFY